MSASLVGSEMCIRDRSDAALPASPSWATDGARAGGKERAGAVAAWRRGTVSYTHLTLPTICSV
eukprot:10181451-Alexandrium_andersonii.AAC.1